MYYIVKYQNFSRFPIKIEQSGCQTDETKEWKGTRRATSFVEKEIAWALKELSKPSDALKTRKKLQVNIAPTQPKCYSLN